MLIKKAFGVGLSTRDLFHLRLSVVKNQSLNSLLGSVLTRAILNVSGTGWFYGLIPLKAMGRYKKFQAGVIGVSVSEGIGAVSVSDGVARPSAFRMG